MSAKIEKDRQAAIEWQRESTKELAKTTKDAVLAYKELYGVYPSKLTDIEGFNDNGTITYSYDGINLPTISYNLDGEIVTETVK